MITNSAWTSPGSFPLLSLALVLLIFFTGLVFLLSWSLGYKPKPKAKKERTEEEKKFRQRAKYFLATQLVAVLVFLSLMGGVDSSELDDDDGMDYED